MPKRHATALRLLPRPSAPATPEVRFQDEPFYIVARELPPLFKKHWRELGRDKDDVPLDPNWDVYMEMSIAGKLRVTTARAGDELVGYVFNIVGPHLHYRSTLHSVVDMYWLDPRYRKGWTGIKMLRANEQMLDRTGVVRRMIAEHLQFKGVHGRMMRVVFKWLGYRPRDVLYAKVTPQ